jgi:peptide subunit release factor RF-3
MLACRTIAAVRVCSGWQLTNVNATVKAKFVDSAKSVAVSRISADDQHACGINGLRSGGDSAIGPTLCLSVMHEPRGSTRDGAVVIP